MAELGLYYRVPATSVAAGRVRAQEEMAVYARQEAHTVSPRHNTARQKAAAAQEKQGQKMQKCATGRHGAVAVGTVVQVAVDNVDRAKTDDTNATLVVVEVVQTGTTQEEDNTGWRARVE